MKRPIPFAALLTLLLILPAWSQPEFDPEGQFVYLLNGEVMAQEDFTVTTQANGDLQLDSVFLLLSEEFMLEFETDRLFDQSIVLSPELALVRYELASDTARGRLRVEVEVADGIASMTFATVDAEGEERQGEQDVILEEGVVASGISGSGAQLMVLYRILRARDIRERTTLLAFNPTNLIQPLVEVEITPLVEVTVRAGDETFPVERVAVSQRLEGENGEPFTVELLARGEELIGYRALSQTSTLLVYRADRFPSGIQVVEGS